MRKTLVALLTAGLLLLGVTPVWAAGQAMEVAAPAQQDEVVQVVVPEGNELEDSTLDRTRGEWAWAVVGAVAGAASSVYDYHRTHKGKGTLIGYATAAFTGAVVGAVGGAYVKAAELAAGKAASYAARAAVGYAQKKFRKVVNSNLP